MNWWPPDLSCLFSWQTVERVGWFGWIVAIPIVYGLGRWDERRRRTQDTTAIRRAVGLEIAANLQTLETLWSEINRPFAYPERPPATAEIGPAVRLVQRDPPRWQRAVWDGELSRVTEALTTDELARVGRFYERLARFDSHRSAIGQPWETIAPMRDVNLHHSGRRAWEDLRAVIDALREEGNPLPPT